tara:strand:+ start:4219 stop:5202 length:984 start_codon:yes stop_codon:yes gene_type:complete
MSNTLTFVPSKTSKYDVTTIVPIAAKQQKNSTVGKDGLKKKLTAKNYEKLIPVPIERFYEILTLDSSSVDSSQAVVDESLYNHFNISTITIQKSLDQNFIENIIDLEKLNDYLSRNHLICQTKTQKLPRKTFKNQTTITIEYFYLKKRKISLKIFNKGTLHITGVPYINFVKPICEIAKSLIYTSNSIISAKLSKELNYCSYKVCMINSIINIHMKLNLYLLKKTIMTVYNYYVSYEPKVYSGCNIKYMSNDNKEITLLVFGSGKIEITGSNCIYQLIEAYNFLKKCIIENVACVISEPDTNENLIESNFTISDKTINDIFVNGISM